MPQGCTVAGRPIATHTRQEPKIKQFYLGIDVGKESFTVALLAGGQAHQGHFKNDLVGFDGGAGDFGAPGTGF